MCVGANFALMEGTLIAAMLLFDGQFRDDGKPEPVGVFSRTAVWLVLALTALNVISTLLECGFAACPDNPVVYELLKSRS